MTYTIVKLLGVGSYGKVSLATTETNELVAIKNLNIAKTSFNSFKLQNILDEIEALKYLSKRCDSIPRYIEYYYNERGREINIVTEYIEGVTLDTYILNKNHILQRDGKLLWSIIYGIVNGLMCIHSNGFAHRDIKLQNLMITPDGNVKYVDLGLACVDKCKWSDCKNVCTGKVGTPLYRSPESYLSDYNITTLEQSKAQDIWALGIVLYQLVNGYENYPFDLPPGTNIYQLRNIIVNGSLKRSNYRNDDNVNKLLDNILIKDPNSRLKIDQIQTLITDIIKGDDILDDDDSSLNTTVEIDYDSE